MRKINSFLVAAVTMFAAVSCNNEILQESLPTGETVVYTASVEEDTKTVLNEDTKTSEWVADDAITVHDGTKGWTFTTKDSGSRADFSNSEGFGDYRPVMAVYPAGEWSANVDAKTVTAYIPTWQQANVGTYHSPAALAVAYSEDASFKFKYATALLKFTVSTDNVTHVIFHGNDTEPITGNVNVVLGNEGVEVTCLETAFTKKEWDEATQTEKEVTENKYGTWVECYAYHDDANRYFVKGETYYIAVAPQVFENGVTVKIRIDEGEEISVKTTGNKVATKAGVILNLGDLEYTAPVVHEWAVAGTFNDWNTTTANPMVKEGDYYVARNITGLHFTAQDGKEESATGFKFVQNGDVWKGSGENGGVMTVGSWSWIWGDNGLNICVDGAVAETAYDIYLDPSKGDNGKFVIVPTGTAMPEDVPAEDPSTYSWGICGHMTSWGESPDIPMTLNDENEWFVAENVVVAADQAFKLRANGTWAVNRGAGGEVAPVTVTSGVEIDVYHDGQDMTVAAGTYNFYLSKDCDKFKVESVGVTPEVTPGEASEWAIIGDFNGSGTWVEKQMLTTVTSNVFVIEDVVVPTDYFSLLVKKFNDSTWSVKYGGGIIYFNPGNCMKVYQGGSDICITKAGTYDFYFDLANTMLYVVNPDVDYTSVSEQTVNGEEPKQEEPEVTANVLYFKPNSNWYGNSKRCSAYFFNSKGNTWVSMTETSTAGLYEVNIPEGYTFGDNVIFCSMNKNTTANNWNNKWNQTVDLVIPTDGKNLFTANNGWDSVTGTWSKR